MKIYPALDLLDGQCVRLRQGDFEQVTVYGLNPLEIMRDFEHAGFENIHMVDLSGARNPAQRQMDLIRDLVKASQMKIQLGGGIRSLSEVQALLEMGIDRVVLGSIAVHHPEIAVTLLKEFGPSRITLALDVFDEGAGEFKVASQGWLQKGGMSVEEALSHYLDAGVNAVLCTDISRDGMMVGPNLLLYRKLVEKFPGIDFQASGGIRSTEDFKALESVGVQSVIVGKAFYEKAIGVQDMLGRKKVC